MYINSINKYIRRKYNKKNKKDKYNGIYSRDFWGLPQSYRRKEKSKLRKLRDRVSP